MDVDKGPGLKLAVGTWDVLVGVEVKEVETVEVVWNLAFNIFPGFELVEGPREGNVVAIDADGWLGNAGALCVEE